MAATSLFHRQKGMTKKQVAGVATGAAVVGAATAVFLTPRSGKEMRGHAATGAKRAKHRAGRMAHHATHKSGHMAQGAAAATDSMSGSDSSEWSGSNQDDAPSDSPRSTAS